MGILFISITVGIAAVALFLIMYYRKNKTADKPGGVGAKDVLESKTGKNDGVYD